MKKRSNRGAARVNAIWLIVILVLFFVAMFFGYSANDERARYEERANAAIQAEAAAKADLAKMQAQTRQISEILGFYDVDDLSSYSDVEAAKQGLADFKAAVGGDADASITTFQATWPLSIAQINANLSSISTLKSGAQSVQADLTAARSASQTLASDKDKTLADLTKELNDLREKTTEEINALEGNIARLTQDRNTADEEAVAARNELAEQVKQRALMESEYQARMNQLLVGIRPPREKDSFDGAIVGVSPRLNMAYINLGTKDRVVRGMVFDVVSADPANRVPKGEVEILNVFEDISEVKILNVQDRFNELAVGDAISNALYDREGDRNAVLAGRFDGKYSRDEVAMLLGQIGINVQDKLDRSTMYLIMGNPLYKDPETGEVLEEPMAVSDLEVYQKAQSYGVQMISLAELRHFFRR
ncbi:MAG: hypothetical protein R3F33_03770 [Planctomycetota bacterium]